MRTLDSAADRQAIVRRMSTITVSDRRLWGKMSAHQMVCHLCDSYWLALGERPASPATGFLKRTVIKWIALRVPAKWPKGTPTPPEVEQGVGGTPPVEFEVDCSGLLSVINRFCDESGDRSISHPFFGQMTRQEWLRWGYLHADHHLRQFGR
jgi:hypothetical protein